MWYPLNSSPPHTFLALTVSDVRPCILERALNRARHVVTKPHCLEPPFLPVECSPCKFAPKADQTRRRIAFGRWCLPKLRRELHSDRPIFLKKALNSFDDLLHNPELVYFALDLDLVARLEDLLQDADCFVRMRSVSILMTLSTHGLGVAAVARRPNMPGIFAALIRDRDDAVRHEAALALEVMSRAVQGIMMLTDNNFSQKLLNRLIGEDDNIVVIHLLTLRKLLNDSRCANKRALRAGGLHVVMFVARSQCAELVANALMALSALLEMPSAVASATKIDLLPRLAEFLECENVGVQAAAASALMCMTAGIPARRRAFGLPLLSLVLDRLENYNAPDMQLYCLKILGNVCEVPAARDALLGYYLPRIEATVFREPRHQPHLERHRHQLLKLIHWRP